MGISRLMNPLKYPIRNNIDKDDYFVHENIAVADLPNSFEIFDSSKYETSAKIYLPTFKTFKKGGKTVKKVPFYTLKISKAWEADIIKKYGNKAISRNIINMFNKWLDRYMKQGIRIYDYNVLASVFYRKELKDSNFIVTELLSRYLQVRKFKDGTDYSTKNNTAKHYRIKPSILKKYGVEVHLINIEVEVEHRIFEPDQMTKKVNENLKEVRYSVDLDAFDSCSTVSTFKSSAAKRFNRKLLGNTEKHYVGQTKSFKYDLMFEAKDYELYQDLESSLGSYRMYNAMMLFAARHENTKRSPKNLRLHNRLLELPKECLGFLRLDGEKLAEIDLKNSQPALLLNILAGNIDVTNQEWTIFDFIDEVDLETLRKEFADNNSVYNKLLKSAQEGRVYETLMDLQEGVTRDEAKKIMMLVLFSGYKSWSKKFLESNPILQYWKDTYPLLHDIIIKLKKGFYHALKKEGLEHPLIADKSPYMASKALLPVFLQRVESSLFIDNILEDLNEKGIIAISKHDAIICKESESVLVEEIMRRKHLDNLIGINNYELDRGILKPPAKQLLNLPSSKDCKETIRNEAA